jgi:adenosine kinase
MTALICGSLAYDTVMVFNGRFKDHILPDSIHMLSVSFFVPELRRNYGGCAGNIAYNLKLLGGDPLVAAAVGRVWVWGFWAGPGLVWMGCVVFAAALLWGGRLLAACHQSSSAVSRCW